MPNLFKSTPVATRDEADQVVLRIGNSEMKFGYKDAFQLSQWLRISAKKAKAFAGDSGQHWSTLAEITDAEENLKEAQKRSF